MSVVAGTVGEGVIGVERTVVGEDTAADGMPPGTADDAGEARDWNIHAVSKVIEPTMTKRLGICITYPPV